MKVDELMIGDWVLFAGDKYRICKEDFSANYNFEPILLSDKILENNGFYKNILDRRDEFGNYYEKHYMAPILYIKMQYDDGRELGRHIEYVHELQHILKMLNIKKDIIL